MKVRTPLLTSLAAASLLCAGAGLAQTPPAAATSAAPPPIVTVRSVPPAAPHIAPPPAFKQLAGNSRWITPAQAAAYPPLANDFLHASHGAPRVSKAQYESWVKTLN
jgi:hypothetical protein